MNSIKYTVYCLWVRGDNVEDIELVRRSIQGDTEAFSRLIKSYEKDLYRISFAITKNDEDALDCIQEAILQAFKSIKGLIYPEYFKTWLIKILLNKCRELLNKNKGIMQLSDYQAVEGHINSDEKIDLKEAVKKLEYDLKVLVILYYFEDMSVKDISNCLGLPQGTVKSRLARAREKLKTYLNISESEVM